MAHKVQRSSAKYEGICFWCCCWCTAQQQCQVSVLLMNSTVDRTVCLRPGTQFAALEKESSTVHQRQSASQLQSSPSLFCISFSASSLRLQLQQQHSPCHPFPLVVVVAHSGIHWQSVTVGTTTGTTTNLLKHRIGVSLFLSASYC